MLAEEVAQVAEEDRNQDSQEEKEDVTHVNRLSILLEIVLRISNSLSHYNFYYDCSTQYLSRCPFTYNSLIYRNEPFDNADETDHKVTVKVDPNEVESYTPGSIHSEKVREFWKSELKAGEWVMDTLEHGYVIPFEKSPPEYEEPNNQSALREQGFVYQAIMDLKKIGVVNFVSEKPHCVSPLSVSYKTGRDGSIKKRLCLDGYRCINDCIKKQKVTLSHLKRALDLTNAGDYQIVYDLKAAYHHILIHPSQVRYLGAAFTRPEGGTQYIVFLYLPFGLSSAVHCITKIIKPINAYIHRKGIKHSIYLDDGRITAASESEANEDQEFVYSTLGKSGWVIEVQKSDKKGDARQVKPYLGFIIDSNSMTVRMEEMKKQRILKQVQETVDQAARPILAKELAGTLGKIVATEPALGPVVIMIARAAYIQLDEAVSNRGWNTRLSLNAESLNGLRFFIDNFSDFDNSTIRSAATEISVLSIIGPPSSFIKSSFATNHVRTMDERIWASDASGFATCAYSVKGPQLYFRGLLTEEERALSSGHRELLAVTRTLEYYQQSCVMNSQVTNIYWITDSTNLATFLTKVSGKSYIQSEVFRIMVICKTLNVRIIPVHLLRDDPRIQIADDGSKTTDTDDWAIDVETFESINKERRGKFTIDLFASDKNTKCRRFFSNFYCKNTSGIDAFAHSWDEEITWICPPIKEVIRVIKKLKTSKTSGVLFVPEWRTADYWTEVFNKEGSLLWPFEFVTTHKPLITQGVFNIRSPLSGKVKFNFLAVEFDSH